MLLRNSNRNVSRFASFDIVYDVRFACMRSSDNRAMRSCCLKSLTIDSNHMRLHLRVHYA